MKNKKLFFLLPIVALTACSTLGKEISKEDALEKAEAIEEQLAEDTEINREMRLAMSTDQGKGEEKVSSSGSYLLKTNSDNEYYCKMEGKTKQNGEETKEAAEFYLVNNEEYEQVCWAKVYDASKKEYVTAAYTKKDNASFNSIVSQLESNLLVPAIYLLTFSYPTSLIESYEKSEDYKVTYYSTGEKNLSIKVNVNVDAEDDENESIVSMVGTFTYDNNRFTKSDVNATSSFGNKQSVKMSVSYKNSLKFTLPSGWEKDIVKAA